MRELPIESGLLNPPALSLASPIRAYQIDSDPRHVAKALGDGVVLADLSGIIVVSLRGRTIMDGSAAPVATAIGEVAVIDGGWWARLAADEALILLPSFEADAVRPLLRQIQSIDGLMTVTDESHGLGTIMVTGSGARRLLRKVTSLDVSADGLANLNAAQTSLANVHARLLRLDRAGYPSYLLTVERSVGDYVWQVLQEAAAEFEFASIDGRLWLEEALP